jgi:hypothetical protein
MHPYYAKNRSKRILLEYEKSDRGFYTLRHVHLLLDVDPRLGIHKIVGQIKGWTSRAIGKVFPVVG